jgi:hypothetical protein
MMHGDRERQRRKAQQQVGKQPNDGSTFDGAFGSRDFPGARAGTPVMACPIAMSACATVIVMILSNDHWISGPL